jgi:ureidoglycolate lyase
MTGPLVRLSAPDAVAFAAFGRFVTGPDQPGHRSFYSDSLHQRPETSAPVLHVNNVPESRLPLAVSQVERHPHAAQCFFPIDVARYLVMVMPSDAAGLPRTDLARGFVLPGTMGVIYSPGVWHLGATVLDRPGHFTVLMWRGGPLQDDDFRKITPLTLIDQT